MLGLMIGFMAILGSWLVAGTAPPAERDGALLVWLGMSVLYILVGWAVECQLKGEEH